jgi:hypothetical protein
MYDPRIEDAGDLLVYHIQTNESIELSDKSRHDIFYTLRDIAQYWKADSDKIREENPWRIINELCIYLRDKQPEGYEITLNLIDRLKNKEYIRNLNILEVLPK